MKKTLYQRGFTLVEMIVVIAIIAVLAAVVIPTTAGFINRARLSNDRVDARNMSSVLTAYLIDNDDIALEDLEANEIRDIVNVGLSDNDRYSFIPRAQGHSFWLNTSTRQIEIRSSYENFGGGMSLYHSQETGLLRRIEASTVTEPGEKLEELFVGFLLLDRGGRSPISQVLSQVRNVKTAQEFDSLVNDPVLPERIKNHINDNFHPSTTLYINDFFAFTLSAGNATKIIFSDRIEVIPAQAFTKAPAGEVRLPLSVVILERGAVEGRLDIKLKTLPAANVTPEKGAFDSGDTLNTVLRQKESEITLLEALSFELELTNPTTYFYSQVTGNYVGKRVAQSVTPDVSEDSFVNLEWRASVAECAVRETEYTNDRDGYVCHYDNYYYAYLHTGQEIVFHQSYIGADLVQHDRGLNLLVMEFTTTYTYYNDENSIVGVVSETADQSYYVDLYNWFWAASVGGNGPYQYYLWTFNSGTYQGSPFHLSERFDVELDTPIRDFGEQFEDYEGYTFKTQGHYNNTSQFSFTDYRVKVFLKNNGSNMVLDGFHMTFRDQDGLTIVEAKGYNDRGQLIARGAFRFAKTLSNEQATQLAALNGQ